MCAVEVPNNPAPDLRPSLGFILLSHHSYGKLSHTFQINVGRRRVYLCSRCTGIAIGILMGIPLLSYLTASFFEYPVLIFVFTLPAIVDWLLQVFKFQESTNSRRLLTGTLVGLTYLVLLVALVRVWLPMLSYYAMAFASYSIVLYVLFRATGVLKGYLADSWRN